ncbi:MAG: FtsX-like permease family protein, partial [bacterium]
LWLHVSASSLVIGFAAGVAAGLVSVWWGARLLRRRRALDLLAGWRALRAAAVRPRATRPAAVVAIGSSLVALALVLLSAVAPVLDAPVAFFGCGAALLVAGLAGYSLGLGRALSRRARALSLRGLTVRNAAAHRGRSLLAVGLVACATFVIVTVAANERNYGHMDPTRKDSGTGGFTLRAISSLPIRHDLTRRSGRAELGFTADEETLLQDVRIYPFLLSSGEDISCLNLARARRPTVLGVSDRMIERGGFTVKTDRPAANPWTLLQRGGDGPVSAFADSESARWQLHKGLGDTLTIPTAEGDEATLQLRGLISTSILAGELLVSEANFRRVYPSETAPRYFLIETPADRADAVADLFRRRLGGLGVEVRSTRGILNDLIGVQNTYLMTFLTLGGLGLLLGTVGLVVVLVRNALERRGEFALMLATGFERRHLAGLLVFENAGLLAAGLFCGAVSALAAVGPHLASLHSSVNWPALIGLLCGIFLFGLAACAVMAAASVRGPVIDALRRE